MIDSKRFFDLSIALPALAVIAPMLLVLIALNKVAAKGPVFFRQIRPGKDANPITLMKFRTMTDARDSDGYLLHDAELLTFFA